MRQQFKIGDEVFLTDGNVYLMNTDEVKGTLIIKDYLKNQQKYTITQTGENLDFLHWYRLNRNTYWIHVSQFIPITEIEVIIL